MSIYTDENCHYLLHPLKILSRGDDIRTPEPQHAMQIPNQARTSFSNAYTD